MTFGKLQDPVVPRCRRRRKSPSPRCHRRTANCPKGKGEGRGTSGFVSFTGVTTPSDERSSPEIGSTPDFLPWGYLGRGRCLVLLGLRCQCAHGSAGVRRHFNPHARPKPAAAVADHTEPRLGSAAGNRQHGRCSTSAPRTGKMAAAAYRLPANRRRSLGHPRPLEPGSAHLREGGHDPNHGFGREYFERWLCERRGRGRGISPPRSNVPFGCGRLPSPRTLKRARRD